MIGSNEISAEHLRLILGVKLKQLRHERRYTLKDLAEKTGLSLSYLSEIEKGKKYPKAEKLILIARALDVSFDEVVSVQVDESLDPLTAILDSPVIKEFPFQFFGIAPTDILDLITNSPHEASALIRTLLEIGRTYDMRVEQFLFAALRSFQKMHNNYFEELEEAAMSFASDHHWPVEPPFDLGLMKSVLVEEYGCVLDDMSMAQYLPLKGFRSVYVAGALPKLLVNPRLLPSQKAFLIAREIGYRYMGLKEETSTSAMLKVDSFEQVLNNFKASYFAGALMMNREVVYDDLKRFFGNEHWDGQALLSIMNRYNATPEMFSYRLSQLVPKLFGLDEMFYLRFNNEAGTGAFHLTKELNMSRVLVPHGIGLNEHYCSRWLSIRLLKELAENQKHGEGEKKNILVGAQRSRFLDSNAEFLVITLARPLVLTDNTNSSIALGFLINDTLKAGIRFWDDPAVPRVLVNETCERCGFTELMCPERSAPPVIHHRAQAQRNQEKALNQLLHDLKQ